MKKKTKILLILISLILLCGIGAVLYFANEKSSQEVASAGTSEHAERPASSLTLGEEEVPLKKQISTLLIIGTDTMDETNRKEAQEYSTHNNALADFMVILVFDDEKKTVQPLQINRDTMCEVPWLSMNGKVAGYSEEQITYAHMYGSGAEDSAYNCLRTCKRFLYQAPIDDYISFTMGSVPVINDLVGGVTVTLDEDLPALGEDYVAGATITLKGQAALKFVRYRDTSLLESNASRMKRHQMYLEAFLPQARKMVASNEDFLPDALEKLSPYLCMEMSVNELSEYIDKLCSYEILPTITYDGSYVQGKYAEFYPEEESVISCVREAYCSD